ncbi:helix-turn-helix domain-containing protein [Brucellaceae bacterium D45D]
MTRTIEMMTFRREVSHKLRVLRHAEHCGDVSQTCCYFGVGRDRFYRWKSAYERTARVGLKTVHVLQKIQPIKSRQRSSKRVCICAGKPPRANADFLVHEPVSRYHNLRCLHLPHS